MGDGATGRAEFGAGDGRILGIGVYNCFGVFGFGASGAAPAWPRQ